MPIYTWLGDTPFTIEAKIEIDDAAKLIIEDQHATAKAAQLELLRFLSTEPANTDNVAMHITTEVMKLKQVVDKLELPICVAGIHLTLLETYGEFCRKCTVVDAKLAKSSITKQIIHGQLCYLAVSTFDSINQRLRCCTPHADITLKILEPTVIHTADLVAVNVNKSIAMLIMAKYPEQFRTAVSRY